jgi:protein O-GlcNAc transferase
VYHRALAIDPWEETAYANLGLTLLGTGNTADAIPALEQAVALDPSLAAARFALAAAYQATGRRDDAITALERGLEFAPTDTLARQMLDSLQGTGRAGQPVAR